MLRLLLAKLQVCTGCLGTAVISELPEHVTESCLGRSWGAMKGRQGHREHCWGTGNFRERMKSVEIGAIGAISSFMIDELTCFRIPYGSSAVC